MCEFERAIAALGENPADRLGGQAQITGNITAGHGENELTEMQ